MNYQEEKAWREGLREGDRVFVSGPGRLARGASVTRVTATQVIIGERRFSRERGSLLGDGYSYNRPVLLPPTPEREKAFERACLITRLERVKWQGVCTDRLRAVVAALETEPPTAAEEVGMAYGIDLTLCKGPYVTRRQADAAATCEDCGGSLYVLTGNPEGFYVLPCICAAPEGETDAEQDAAGEGAGG